MRTWALPLDGVHGDVAVAAGTSGRESTLGVLLEGDAMDGNNYTPKKHVSYLYPPTNTKRSAEAGQEEAAGPPRSSQELMLAGARGRWECTAGAAPKSEITDAGRMKECKLIKDKSVGCQTVAGGFNSVTESAGLWERAGQPSPQRPSLTRRTGEQT